MAYINAAKVKTIRDQIKKQFPTWKFSIRREGSSGIGVTILAADIDFMAAYKGEQPRQGGIQVNHYYLERSFEGDALKALETIKALANDGNHDRSDTQSDYFDVGWYFSLNIGDYDQPFTKL